MRSGCERLFVALGGFQLDLGLKGCLVWGCWEFLKWYLIRRVLAKAVMSSESLLRLGVGGVGTKPRPLESADRVA